MSGELNIMNGKFENELLELEAPLAFIDFEAFMPQEPGIIPGTMVTDTIPCQWSCHILWQHGTQWMGNLDHGEYLWEGDVGWNPIYSFVQSLYEYTQDAGTILIYTGYEIRCLQICKQLAENDIAKMRVNDLLDGYFMLEDNEKTPLAERYDVLLDYIEYRDYDTYPIDIYDEKTDSIVDISEISDMIDEWHSMDPIPFDYLVVDMYGNKVPLMSIAPMISEWCDSMLSRFYDMCYGHVHEISGSFKSMHDGGVERWIRSPEIGRSNSIKHVMPAAMMEYSGSAELLESEGEPENAYDGLRARGNIAKGDECTETYTKALDRPKRSNVSSWENGHAPFDQDVEQQCLIYCRLDTLSMVIIYLAVIEATEWWRHGSDDDNGNIGTTNEMVSFARFTDDGMFHILRVDADTRSVYKWCDIEMLEPYDYSEELEIVSMTEEEFSDLDVRQMHKEFCPKCIWERTHDFTR